MSRMTRDGTPELVSARPNSQVPTGTEKCPFFPVQLASSKIGNLARLIRTPLCTMTINTYMLYLTNALWLIADQRTLVRRRFRAER